MPALRAKLIILLLVGGLLAFVLLAHPTWLSGPSYWKWPTRHVPALRWYPPMLLAAAPLLIATLYATQRPLIVIALLMVSMFVMQLTSVVLADTPLSFDRITYTIESPTNTSYFADADRSMHIPIRQLLVNYPNYMPWFHMHSQEKPPGPILFFRVILGIFGSSDRTALLAGLIIGALTTLAIPATFAMIKMLTGDQQAAVFGASFIALAPGLVLHFPQMDQLYPIVTCALIICWKSALATDKARWGAAFGVLLAFACFIVYHFLVLGFFLAALTLWHVGRGFPQRARPVLICIFWVIAAFIAFYLCLAFVGFDPIATFKMALHNQSEHLKNLYRPYPKTIWDDLADFALGCGWLSWLLTMFLFVRTNGNRRQLLLAILCIAQIILLAITGLMQTETARTWCFLLPLMAVPVGLELSTWPRGARFIAITAMWLILCLVGQNMKFVFKPTEQQTAPSAVAATPASPVRGYQRRRRRRSYRERSA